MAAALRQVARRSSDRSSCCVPYSEGLTYNGVRAWVASQIRVHFFGPSTWATGVIEAFGSCHYAAVFIRGHGEDGTSYRVKRTVRICFHEPWVTCSGVVCGPREPVSNYRGWHWRRGGVIRFGEGVGSSFTSPTISHVSTNSDSSAPVFLVLYSESLSSYVFWEPIDLETFSNLKLNGLRGPEMVSLCVVTGSCGWDFVEW